MVCITIRNHENSPKRLALLLADKINVEQYLDVHRRGKVIQ